MYSSTLGRKSNAFDKVIEKWGPHARPYLNPALSNHFLENVAAFAAKFLLDEALELFCKVVIECLRDTRGGRGAARQVSASDCQTLLLADLEQLDQVRRAALLNDDEGRGYSIESNEVLLAQMRGKDPIHPKEAKKLRRQLRK